MKLVDRTEYAHPCIVSHGLSLYVMLQQGLLSLFHADIRYFLALHALDIGRHVSFFPHGTRFSVAERLPKPEYHRPQRQRKTKRRRREDEASRTVICFFFLFVSSSHEPISPLGGSLPSAVIPRASITKMNSGVFIRPYNPVRLLSSTTSPRMYAMLGIYIPFATSNTRNVANCRISPLNKAKHVRLTPATTMAQMSRHTGDLAALVLGIFRIFEPDKALNRSAPIIIAAMNEAKTTP